MADKLVKRDAKLGFKVGTQAAVDAILTAGSGAIHGSFYLATDTHRLYIGNEDTSLSPVNEGIITVEHLTDLPSATPANAGQFYYITGETDTVRNVLTVSNGHSWVHINANSNTYVTEHDFTTVDITDGAQIEGNIRNSDNSTKTGRFHIKGANGTTVSHSTTTITINGQTVTVPVITVSGDTYTLESQQDGTNQVKVNLNSANSDNDSSITLKAASGPQGESAVTLSNNNGIISIGAKDSQNTSVSVTGESNGFKVAVTDNYNHSVEGTISPKIQVGNNTPINFVNGTAILDVYSKDEIDSTLKVLNAMTYRGTLGDGGTAATVLDGTTWYPRLNGNPVDISIGDTFLTTSTINYNNQSILAGSLLIARGTEDPNTGYITSNLTYDIVKASSDHDTTYSFKATSDGLALQAVTGNTTGELAFIAGNNIEVDFSASDAGSGGMAVTNGKQTVTIKHKNVTRSDTTGTAVTGTKSNTTNNFQGQTVIPVVTGVSTDAQGHLTGVETTQYTVYDTNSRITASTYSTSNYTDNDKNVGVIKHSITTTHGGGGSNTVDSYEAISSTSLVITKDDSNARSATDSSQASGLNIEMVWGSF